MLYIVMFFAVILINLGMRYFQIENDLFSVVLVALLTVGILKVINKKL